MPLRAKSHRERIVFETLYDALHQLSAIARGLRMLQNVVHLERKLSTFVRLSDLERQCLNEIQQSPVFVKGGQRADAPR